MTKRGKIWLAVGALIAGVCIGQLFRNETRGERGTTARTSDSAEISPLDPREITNARSQRPRRLIDEGISFSRKQWSQLVRNPNLGKIAIADYLDATKQLEDRIPIVGDIPLIGRLFESPAKNDLATQTAFFGWDERRTRGVRAALIRFGDDLTAAEKTGARVEYPDGGVQIDFSDCQSQRAEIAAKLNRELVEALGERDAERFASLSRMDGLARELPENIDIVGPDFGVIIYTDPDAPDDKTILPDLSSSITNRIRHLDQDIDWKRSIEPTLPARK